MILAVSFLFILIYIDKILSDKVFLIKVSHTLSKIKSESIKIHKKSMITPYSSRFDKKLQKKLPVLVKKLFCGVILYTL